MNYANVSNYVADTRDFLQDFVQPFRYPDGTILSALNIAVSEIARLRPDIFLDLKYQSPLPQFAPLNDGIPQAYLVVDATTVPVPQIYYQAIIWYMAAYCQFLDVDDTQDARAQAFTQKFIGSLTGIAA